MRIKGKSAQSFRSDLPILGKIKIGEKNQRGFPQSLDYFKCISKYERLFYDTFDKKVNQLTISFHSDDTNKVCFERFEFRDKSGSLVIDGDGELFNFFDGAKYRQTNDKDLIKTVVKNNNLKMSRILTIRFLIPAIKELFGVWELSTKAEKSSIESIINTFDTVQKNAGTVVNIPFNLNVSRIKSQRNYIINGKQMKPVFSVIDLVPNISQENISMVHNYISGGNTMESINILDDNKIKMLGK